MGVFTIFWYGSGQETIPKYLIQSSLFRHSYSLLFSSQYSNFLDTIYPAQLKNLKFSFVNLWCRATLYESYQLPWQIFPGVPSLSDLDDNQLKAMIQTSSATGRAMCGICLKEFYNRSSAFIHIQAVHVAKRSVKCFYCPKTFKTKNCRIKHITKYHAEAHRINKLIKKSVRLFSYRIFWSDFKTFISFYIWYFLYFGILYLSTWNVKLLESYTPWKYLFELIFCVSPF